MPCFRHNSENTMNPYTSASIAAFLEVLGKSYTRDDIPSLWPYFIQRN